MYFSEDIKNYENTIFNSNKLYDFTSYGPDFKTLDETLQQNFMEFFNSFGLNDDLAGFIETLATDKEQVLYNAWLNKIDSCIDYLH